MGGLRPGATCGALLVTLLAVASGASAALDFELIVEADGTVEYVTGSALLIEARNLTPNASASFQVTKEGSAGPRGAITFRGFFHASWAKQVLSKVDERYLGEFLSDNASDIENADPTEDLANITGTATEQRFLFSLVAGSRNLSFAKDLVPPVYDVGPEEGLTYRSFLIVTTTDEPARGTLLIGPKGSTKEPIPYPTPSAAFRQNFPVISLRGNTTYAYWFLFEDFSGNRVTSETFEVTTPPEPVYPPVVLVERFPENRSVLAVSPEEIRARVMSPNGAIPSHGVRLFVDLHEVHEGLVFDGTNVTYTVPQPLAPGLHSVGLEVQDEIGGKLVTKWYFTVSAPRPEAPAPGIGAFLMAAFAAVSLLRRGP